MKKEYLSARLSLATSVLLILLAALTASCTTATPATSKIGVVVTLLPQAEFIENVGGNKVTVTVMVPPGASPHTYEPTPSQMTALAKAKIYAKVGSGVEFELVWMDKLSAANQDMLVVDCSEGTSLQEITGEHKHTHNIMDPHIWMSPRNARIMAQNIYTGLVRIDPENSADYESNLNAYVKRLDELDRDIKAGLAGVTNRQFMVYHPSLGYFAREYNLTILPIEEAGKEPTPAGLTRLIKQTEAHNIKVIFASPQFNPQSAEVIASTIDGKVIFIDPLARSYIANLRSLLNELVQAME
jgi:zinc transport system substrate-binding protein